MRLEQEIPSASCLELPLISNGREFQTTAAPSYITMPEDMDSLSLQARKRMRLAAAAEMRQLDQQVGVREELECDNMYVEY